MKHMRHYVRTTAICLLATLLAACTMAPTPPTTKGSEEEIYHIYPNEMSREGWAIDRDGNMSPIDTESYILYDVITGEPQCQRRFREEDTGERDEYGGIITRDMSALYDMDGNLLYDWAPCYYEAAFGDYIIRQNRRVPFFIEDALPADFVSELWNYKTGQSVLPEVGQGEPLGEGECVLLCGPLRKPLGVVRADTLEKVSGFPAPEPYQYAYTWQDYIIANPRPALSGEDKPEYRDTLMTRDFEPLFTHRSMYGTTSPGILNFYDEDESGGLIAPDGHVLLTYAPFEWAPYVDSEIVVLRYSNYGEGMEEEYAHLVRLADGTCLSEKYDRIEPARFYDDEAPAERFIAARGNTVFILDRTGAVVISQSLPNQVTGIEYADNDRIRCNTKTGDLYTDALLDMKLNIVVPVGRYNNIMPLTNWTTREAVYYPAFSGQGKIDPKIDYSARSDEPGARMPGRPYYESSIDILDADGNLLTGGINELYGAGDDRLAVRKGFSIGLMDWHGKWIVQKSIFEDSLKD